MRNRLTLGKILMFLLLPIFIYSAEVRAFVDKKVVQKGDNITYTIEATGDNVEFPQIDNLDGLELNGVSSSTNISIINAQYNKTFVKNYNFRVDKNTTIPSFVVKVNSNEYKTKPIDIKVVKRTKAINAGGAKVELIANKTEAYVGEPIILKVKITLPRDIVKYQIEPPEYKNFWVKELRKPIKKVFGNSIVIEYRFLLTPQKAGKLTLEPIVIDIAKRSRNRQNPFGDDDFFDIFTESLNWSKIKSNSLSFNISALPQNLEVAGNFDFKVKVDKTKVPANKPVNLTIKIRGKGNLEDIKKFELNLPDAVVYADEPKVRTYISNGAEVGEFTQKIAVIADNNITIPSIEFKYFDLKKKEVVIKKSKPIKIEVIGAKANSTSIPKIESATPVKLTNSKEVVKTVYKEQNGWLKYLLFVLGVIVGAIGMFVFNNYKLKSSKKSLLDKPIVKQIKKAKSDKELFKILLPYSKNSMIIEKTLKQLEENIYKNGKNKIDKNSLIEYFEDELYE